MSSYSISNTPNSSTPDDDSSGRIYNDRQPTSSHLVSSGLPTASPTSKKFIQLVRQIIRKRTKWRNLSLSSSSVYSHDLHTIDNISQCMKELTDFQMAEIIRVRMSYKGNAKMLHEEEGRIIEELMKKGISVEDPFLDVLTVFHFPKPKRKRKKIEIIPIEELQKKQNEVETIRNTDERVEPHRPSSYSCTAEMDPVIREDISIRNEDAQMGGEAEIENGEEQESMHGEMEDCDYLNIVLGVLLYYIVLGSLADDWRLYVISGY